MEKKQVVIDGGVRLSHNSHKLLSSHGKLPPIPQQAILKNSVLYYFIIVKYILLVLIIVSVVEGWLSLSFTRKAFEELISALKEEKLLSSNLTPGQSEAIFFSIVGAYLFFEILGFIGVLAESFCTLILYSITVSFRLLIGLASLAYPRLIIYFGLSVFLDSLVILFAIMLRNIQQTVKYKKSLFV